MVAAESNLVTFRQGALSGSIVASAEADAVAQFELRRGVRFSAEAKAAIQAHLSGQLGPDPQQRSAAAAPPHIDVRCDSRGEFRTFRRPSDSGPRIV
jgi:hypothetical protein